jgi:hypothetical protein
MALGAAIVALAVATVPATADVNPEPLWNAYPLQGGARTAVPSTNGQGTTAPAARPQGRPAATGPAAPAAGADGGRSPLLAVAIGALTAVALALAWVLVAASLSRRRAQTRELRPPDGPVAIPPRPEPVAALPAPAAEPEECEIVWWTEGADPQFRAVGRNGTGRGYVAARSPGVADPRPPLRQGETLEAWEALVEHLEKRGWTPYGPPPAGNGRPWYAQRFERRARTARPPARAGGDRA